MTAPPLQMRYCNLIIFFLILSFWVYTPSAANAYVLKGSHILDIMTKRLGKAKTLLVTQKIVVHRHDGTPLKTTVQVSETLRYIFPATYRSDIATENLQKIYVLSGTRSLTVIDEKIVDGYENKYDRYKDLILLRSRPLLQSSLPLLGVNLAVSSIGRFQNQLAYVIGAQYPDESVSQIWLKKETFRPLRWIIKDKTNESETDGIEIRYLEWREVDSIWYPMRIAFFRDHTLLREVLVENIQVDPPFSRNLFDIDHLKTIYAPITTLAPGQDESDELSEVQKTIEEFKKIYE